MKKIFFRLAALTTTFFIGLTIFVFVFLESNSIPKIASPELPTGQDNQKCYADCIDTSFPGLSIKIAELKKGRSRYFPKGNFSGKWEKRDDFVNDWYGSHLRAMGEKSLLAANQTAETYRFLWLRTFHHPIFVRIERRDDEINLFTKELDGAGGYEPGKVLRSNKLSIKPEDFCKFLKLLEEANYWNLPIDNDDMGNDGAQWVLEGVRNGRYHAVDRWTPQTGEFREACLFLLKLSGVDTDRLKDDLY